ncbi:hypothetical protein BUALT_Bualt07G0077700 [Buddleja alternifolia]|uniref:Uncharacterized protein n=1 Tax=Buddleja alternifolia TaxID=168488 RepID=A0AAV6XJV9_9LAMI|nr:hypothetical protein BUALT_Bualt07G0077700 [Buddleja alternifolia]
MGTFEEEVQRKLDEPMPWIGLYIAAASAVCTLAMTADVINGFRQKKLWFPSKYFTLSATSLTLLAVAMKLPTDLNTNMLYQADWYTKLSGLIFMSTAMGNFAPSLGSMNDKEILSNIIALGILVITIVVNVWIQLIQLHHLLPPVIILGVAVPIILVLLLLATLASLAITVPSTKRSMESKYQDMHKLVLREEEALKRTIDKQMMMKYWVMAESSSPQFVMARSIVCTTSSLICVLASITIVMSYITMTYANWFFHIRYASLGQPGSVYEKISQPRSVYGSFPVYLILVIQCIGVVVGTIAPTLRLFVAIWFRCSTTIPKNNKSSLKDELFKIETYWIQKLVDWRDSFKNSSLQIRQDDKYMKYFHNVKCLVLNFFIGVQILIVVVSKQLLYVSVLLTTPFANIMNKINIQFSSKVATSSDNHVVSDDTELSLSRYVLLLEGEPKLPKRILNNICRHADNMIFIGKRMQPQNLINLLHKFVNFSGVIQFDSTNQVPSLHFQEPPNCWMLPLMTLTSIAISLPNVAEHKRKQLVSSVNEGLFLAKLIDKILDANAKLVNIRKSADISWVGVALYRKWQDVDLRTTSRKCKNSKDVLKELSNKAEMTVIEFKREMKDFLMENPLNWPVKIIAANSMYRVSRTILLAYKGENEPTDEELFERLSVMIADILAACLTNLPRVIATMCHRNAIEKRERNVREAFILLGKTEQVIQLLHRHEWPSLDADKASYIDEWRSLIHQDNEIPATSISTSSPGKAVKTPVSNADHITVTVAQSPSLS